MKKGLAIGGALLISIGILLYLNKTAKKGRGNTGGGTGGGNTGGGTGGGNTGGGTGGGNTGGGNTGGGNTGGGTGGGNTGGGTTHQGGDRIREVIVKLPQGNLAQKLTRLRKSCERKGGTWVEERDSAGLVVIGGTCINLPVPASVLNQVSNIAHVGSLNITYQSPSHGGIRNNTSSNTGSSQDTSGSSVGEVGGGAGGGSAPSGGGVGGDGCFVKGTLVTLFDGEKIKIENIKEGAEVLTYHKERGNEKGVVIKLLKPKSNNIIQIEFEDGTKIQCTKEHPIYIKGKGWSSVTPLRSIIKHGVKSKKLKVGDIALKEILETKITNISNVITEEQELYNLMINGNRNYYANGVLVHNKGTGNVDNVPSTSSGEYGVTDEEIGTIIDAYLDEYA
jgi:hypothetical protein